MTAPTPTPQRTTSTDPSVERAVLDAMSDPILIMGLADDGRWLIEFVNQASEVLTGWPAADVVGREPVHMIGPLTDPDLLSSAFAEAAGGGTISRRIVLHRRDGGPVFCELRGGLVSGSHDRLRAWAQLVIEETLEGGEYRRLLENVSDTVAVLDGDGIIRYISPSVRYLAPVAPTELIGTSIFNLLRPDREGRQEAIWQSVLASPGLHGPVEAVLIGADGEDIPVDVVLNNRLDDEEMHGIVVTARSAVDRRAAEAVAARMERRLQGLVQHASDIVLVLDGDGRVTYTSPSVERLLGPLVEPAADNGRVLELFHPADLPKALAAIAARLDIPGHAGVMEVRLRNAAGGWTWFELAATNLLADPDLAGVVINGRDIDERRRTQALLAGELSVLETMAGSHTLAPVLRHLAEIAESYLPGAACSIGVMDDDGVIRHAAAPTLPSAVVAALDAESPDGPLGTVVRQSPERVISIDVGADPAWGTLGAVAAGNGYHSCWWMPVRGAASDDVLGVVLVFHPERRGPTEAEKAALDRFRHLGTLALERGRFDRQLEHHAVHDGLTGLPNRILLVDRVERALEVGRHRGTHTAVLFVDVDRFKVVNDSLGHAAGDELLRQITDRLVGAVGPGDTVARFGGDEFVVVAEEVVSEAGAVAAGARLLATLDEDLEILGQPVRVSASIGVAVAGPDAEDVGPDAMIRNAEVAMHRAKDAGRGRVAVFEEMLHAEAVRRYELEQGLRTAVEAGELTVLYQPRVRLADGRLTGAEALLRWDRPGHDQVGATDLVPIAEETGLIVPIGAWVLEAACAQAVAWDANPATRGLDVSVNLSARQLTDPGVVGLVAGTLAATGLPAARLCLEVTESALAADPDAAVAALGALKALGVRLAIDDFGTGYATLDYVRRFSMADELKIDRSFVAGVADIDSPDAAIVSAAVTLANALGFEVCAEGVETAEQLAVLKRLGCRAAQGYWFSRPVPPDQI